MATRTTGIAKRSVLAPDEVRRFAHGHLDLIDLGGTTLGHFIFEPGWRWTTSVRPSAGTATCQVDHLGYVIRGRLRVRMDDGTEADLEPGEFFTVQPGHDAWVVGDEPFEALELKGARSYGVPARAAKPGHVTLVPDGVAERTPAPSPIVGQRPTQVLQRFVALLNAGRIGDLGQAMRDDVVDHDLWPGQGPGLAGMQESIGSLRAAFPDAKLTAEDVFEAGDRVAFGMAMEGTHRGELFGVAPTGRRIKFRGTGIFRVADGKVVESWGGPDLLGVMAQLGALPGGTR